MRFPILTRGILRYTFTSCSGRKKSNRKTDFKKRSNTKIKNGANMKEARNIENPVINNLIEEGGENFYNYLECHGLADEDNMLVLSSKHHYYYDPTELERITTLINVKQLNLIKHLDSFLHSVVHVLSPDSNFVGCFYDWKSQKSTGFTARIFKNLVNFIDAKIDVDYDKKDVSRLLEAHGFRVVDMTEINGLTYFRAQNLGLQAN
jgi:hypothetical protein